MILERGIDLFRRTVYSYTLPTTHHVVTQTRWTIPAATVDRIKQIKTSGKSLAWKSLPSKTVSKLETAVKLKINNQDAMNPPRMVADCVDESRGL